MKIVVLKFGGTSVGTIEKIKRVAKIIIDYKKKNYKVIVVSSAMSGVTNELIKKSLEKHAGKRKLAAEELGISERTLYRKIKQFDL